MDESDKQRVELERLAKLTLKIMALRVEHVRDCPRCQGVFVAGYTAKAEKVGATPSDGWGLIRLLLPDLFPCPDWPGPTN